MKVHRIALAFSLLALAQLPVASQTKPTAEQEFHALVEQLKQELKQTPPSRRTPSSFSDELAQFDAIVQRHHDISDELAAEIGFKKGTFYYQAFKAPEKAIPILQGVIDTYPNTNHAQQAREAIVGFRKSIRFKQARKSLIPGNPFPPFSGIDTDGKPLSLGEYASNLTLVLFWSHDCDTCAVFTPKYKTLRSTFEEYGFDIVAISIDQDLANLRKAKRAEEIDWKICFDPRGWGSDLIAKYGVESIPESYLLDEEGDIIGRNIPIDQLDDFLSSYYSR